MHSAQTGSTIDAFLKTLAAWAAEQPDILAVALVGSYANRTARADSDVDLVLLVADPKTYFFKADWMARFGAVFSFRDEDWGQLRSRRVHYAGGLEVEFGFATAAWAGTNPLDAGTGKVVADGLVCVYDPAGVFAALVSAVESH